MSEQTPTHDGPTDVFGGRVPVSTESAFFNAARPTLFVLLEGSDDVRFWRKFIDTAQCQLRNMKGRDNALNELNRKAVVPGTMLVILDADLDRINESLLKHPDIIWTDYHDLEVVMLESPALEDVLRVSASEDKLSAFEATHGSIRSALYRLATPIGKLRWLSHRDSLGLTFRKPDEKGFRYVNYADFCDTSAVTVDEKRMITTVLNFSNQPKPTEQQLELHQKLRSLPDPDVRQLCNGHDLLNILGIGLAKAWGNVKQTSGELAKDLSLAFSVEFLQGTQMYRTLSIWQDAHPHMPLLLARPIPTRP